MGQVSPLFQLFLAFSSILDAFSVIFVYIFSFSTHALHFFVLFCIRLFSGDLSVQFWCVLVRFLNIFMHFGALSAPVSPGEANGG